MNKQIIFAMLLVNSLFAATAASGDLADSERSSPVVQQGFVTPPDQIVPAHLAWQVAGQTVITPISPTNSNHSSVYSYQQYQTDEEAFADSDDNDIHNGITPMNWTVFVINIAEETMQQVATSIDNKESER